MVKMRMTAADVAAQVACLQRLVGFRLANVYDLDAKTFVLKLSKSGGATATGESEKALLLIESGVRIHTTAYGTASCAAPPCGASLRGWRVCVRGCAPSHGDRVSKGAVCRQTVRRAHNEAFRRPKGCVNHSVHLRVHARVCVCCPTARACVRLSPCSWLLADPPRPKQSCLACLVSLPAREKSESPSGVTLKVRKHVRTRRLEAVRQVGADRIVQLTFSRGEGEHHLFLELYSQGNVVLCDREMNVLTLLRSHRDDARGFAVMPNHAYPLEHFRPRTAASAQALRAALAEGAEAGESLKQALLARFAGGLGPQLAEHALRAAGVGDPRQPCAPAVAEGGALAEGTPAEQALLEALCSIDAFLNACAAGEAPPGYITRKRAKAPKGADADAQPVIYDDVVPMLYAQLNAASATGELAPLEFATFDASMDEYFSRIEEQKADAVRTQQESAARNKLTKVQQDQEKRASQLRDEVELQERKAQLIEYNLEAVDAAIGAVNGALAGGMDWADLAQLIKTEKKAGNPVASIVHSLHLERNAITLLLSNTLDEDDPEVDVKVEVSLDRSAYANAREHFITRKKRAGKAQKTLDAQDVALAAAERKMEQQLGQIKTTSAIHKARKVHWFEKFHWFVSSENYLVISGRDAQQNEQVVKRYLKGGNLYVHADLHGATSCIVINSGGPGSDVPPLTLQQAGTFCVCRSKAWDSKVVSSAWWVRADQVSKTAPSGEYLTTGSFMIRGKKNFLPPAQLVMGFTFLFKLDESSVAAHLGERAPRVGDGDNDGGVDSEAGDVEQLDTASGAASATRKPEGLLGDDDGGSSKVGVDGGGESSSDSATPAADPDGASTPEAAGGSDVGAAAGADDDQEDDLFAAMDTMRLTGTRREGGQSDTIELERAGGAPSAATQESPAGEEEELPPANERNGSGKRYMSKRDRRRAAKEGNTCVAPPKETEEEAAERARALEEAREAERKRREEKAARQAEAANARSAEGRTRGKKAKLKKMKKYADQEDEDRELSMALLGSAGTSKKERQAQAALEAAEAKAKREREKEERKRANDAKFRALAGAAAAEQASEQAAGSRQERRAAARAEASVERAEIDAILEEENVMELSEAQREQMLEIDAFTGTPAEGDVLQYAIPMCAPYSSLSTKLYRSRVKLTPAGGAGGKKGRLARTAVEVFCRTSGCSDRERELMRAVSDVELTAQMISGKLSTPGLQQVKTAQKQRKKQSAKQKAKR